MNKLILGTMAGLAVLIWGIEGNAQALHPKPEAAIDACRKQVVATIIKAKTGKDLDLVTLQLATTCSELYVERKCRQSFVNLGQLSPDQRSAHLARSCRDAYCPLLAKPLPKLCAQKKLPNNPTKLAKLWKELHWRILSRDLGPKLALNIYVALNTMQNAVQAAKVSPPQKANPINDKKIPADLHLYLGTQDLVVEGLGLHLSFSPISELKKSKAFKKAIKGKASKLIVRLQPTLVLPYKNVAAVIDILKEMRLTRVILAPPKR